MAGVDEQDLGHAERARVVGVLVERAAHHQRRAGLAHRVDVQQQLGGVDEGAQLAGAFQAGAFALCASTGRMKPVLASPPGALRSGCGFESRVPGRDATS